MVSETPWGWLIVVATVRFAYISSTHRYEAGAELEPDGFYPAINLATLLSSLPTPE